MINASENTVQSVLTAIRNLEATTEEFLNQNNGGQEQFLKDLEDSDMFYGEAFYTGKTEAVSSIAKLAHDLAKQQTISFGSFSKTLLAELSQKLAEAKDNAVELEGGMERFLGDLQESSDFFDEAHSNGFIEGLEEIKGLIAKHSGE